MYTYTYTSTYVYVYMYMYMCDVCFMCALDRFLDSVSPNGGR